MRDLFGREECYSEQSKDKLDYFVFILCFYSSFILSTFCGVHEKSCESRKRQDIIETELNENHN